MSLPDTDKRWMEAAARLAFRARPSSAPNPSVGCVIVQDGRLIARSWTQPTGRPHAEAAALAHAGSAAKGSTIYVTLEPCAHVSERGPACSDLLIEAEPARVVVGLKDPDPRTNGKGIDRLRDAGIAVDLFDESESVVRSLAGFLTRQRLGRPHVTLKLAMSLDGCIALTDGTSQWITGDAARAHVHSRRALADAILVGGGTWRADKPRLSVRLPGPEERSPKRWVLTSQAIEGAQSISAPSQISAIPAQYLYIEGGAATAGCFLAEDLVDRLEIYRAPIVIGDGKRAISGLPLADLPSAHHRWRRVEQRTLGPDTFEAYERIREHG